MIHLIWTILVGFIVGVLAKFLHPGGEKIGFIITSLLGIGGSVLATYAGQALGFYRAGERVGFIGALIGALVILIVYGFIVNR